MIYVNNNNYYHFNEIHNVMHMPRCALICCSCGLTNEFLVATPLDTNIYLI